MPSTVWRTVQASERSPILRSARQTTASFAPSSLSAPAARTKTDKQDARASHPRHVAQEQGRAGGCGEVTLREHPPKCALRRANGGLSGARETSARPGIRLVYGRHES